MVRGHPVTLKPLLFSLAEPLAYGESYLNK
jgi:hypothetical protein